MPRFKDLTGRKFGRLTAVRYLGRSKWECICDCGRITTTPMSHDLTRGATNSCGCLTVEHISNVNRTHGMTGTRTHKAWANMIQRCTNPKVRSYKDYGARGISVCAAWAASFSQFLADMGECPDGYTIERINPAGNYEPTNCKWVPRAEQANNRRNSVRILGFTARELSELLGVKRDTIYMRLRRNPTKLIDQVKELKNGHHSHHCAQGHQTQ